MPKEKDGVGAGGAGGAGAALEAGLDRDEKGFAVEVFPAGGAPQVEERVDPRAPNGLGAGDVEEDAPPPPGSATLRFGIPRILSRGGKVSGYD